MSSYALGCGQFCFLFLISLAREKIRKAQSDQSVSQGKDVQKALWIREEDGSEDGTQSQPDYIKSYSIFQPRAQSHRLYLLAGAQFCDKTGFLHITKTLIQSLFLTLRNRLLAALCKTVEQDDQLEPTGEFTCCWSLCFYELMLN